MPTGPTGQPSPDISDVIRATSATIKVFSSDVTTLGTNIKNITDKIDALVSNFNVLASTLEDNNVIQDALIKGNKEYAARVEQVQQAHQQEQFNSYSKFLDDTLSQAQELRKEETEINKGMGSEYLKTTFATKLKEINKAKEAGDLTYKNWATLYSRMLSIQLDFNKKSYKESSKERGINVLRDRLTGLAQALPAPAKDIFKVAGGFESIAKMSMRTSIGLLAIVEFFKQIFSFANDAVMNVNMFARAGGILNTSLDSSVRLTPLLSDAYVDNADAAKSASAILDEYGALTSNLMDTQKSSASVLAYSSIKQDQFMADLFTTSVQLAKMGPMFGMAGDAAAKTMGQLISRFHEDISGIGKGFESLARISMGLNVSTTDFSNVIVKAGDTLRWFNKDGMSPVIGRFAILGNNMMDLARKGDRFWKGLNAAEMLETFQKITDAVAQMRPETFLALRPGATPTTVPGLAAGIQEFYEKDPISALRESIMGMTQKLTDTGMAQSDAFLLMSTSGPFAEFGRQGPALFKALTSLSEQQLKEGGAASDMSKLVDLAAKHFPGQAKDLEGLRNAQAILGDPLKVMERTLIKIFRILFAWSAGGAVTKMVEGLTNVSHLTDTEFMAKQLSAGTAQITKPRPGM